MPNGVMTGTGTQADPWIVEDGWDFNALRNVTGGDWAELANDINLSMFANFAPINLSINLNGNGHLIHDFFIQNSGGNTGIFGSMTTLAGAREIRDVRLMGEVVAQGMGNTNHAGMLLGSLTNNNSSTTMNLSNIQCFGSISVIATGGTGGHNQGVGGCFGHIIINGTSSTTHISNCSFHGTIQYHVAFTGSNTGAVSSTNSRGVGGIIGVFHRSAGTNSSISRCITNLNLFIHGGTAASHHGGIIANLRTGGGSVNINRCVSVMSVQFTNTADLLQTHPMTVAGTIGHVFEGNGGVSLCAAHSDIIYDPPGEISALNLGGLIGGMNGTGTNTLANSYSVMRLINPNDLPMPEYLSVRGTGGLATQNITHSNTFFDATVLAEGWSGAVQRNEHGRTTAQLQNRAFLETQGWVFA